MVAIGFLMFTSLAGFSHGDVTIPGNQGGQLYDTFSTCTLGGTPNPNLWITQNTAQISLDTCRHAGYLNIYNLCENPIYGYSCGTQSTGGIVSQTQFDPILPTGEVTFEARATNIVRADGTQSANGGTLTLFLNHESGLGNGVSTNGQTWYIGARIAIVGSASSPQTNFYAIWDSPAGQNGVNLGTINSVGLGVHFLLTWQRYNGADFVKVHMDSVYNSVQYNFDYTVYPTGANNYQGMDDQHAYTVWVEGDIDCLVYLAQGTRDNPPTSQYTDTISQKTVTFNATTTNDSPITSYAWNFGDTTQVTTTTAQTSHTYPPGPATQYTVTLQVTDSHSFQSTVYSSTITV